MQYSVPSHVHSPCTCERIPCTCEALHMREKLTSASYKQKVEKWDSDSDSDISDEEDLAV